MPTITLNHITKIEGHAKLTLGIEENKVTVCQLGATEGARYFEGIVVGRRYNEANELTSRICGICSCAHVIAAITAIENAIGFTPSEQTIKLRELLTLAERIRSHATHLYFLALPDYLGYESAIAMAPKYKKELQRALNMMKVGNHMIKTLAARALHPVSAAVGGWLKLPSQDDMDAMGKALDGIKKDAEDTCKLFFSLKYPDFQTEGLFFSLKSEKEYAMLSGNFCSGDRCHAPEQYMNHIAEFHQEYSNANYATEDGKRFFVGAIARLNNNSKFLSPNAQKMLKLSKIRLPSQNPFHNTHAQAVELVHSIDHALEICKTLKIKDEKIPQIPIKAGRGVGAIEVPRGTLWHEYVVDEHGVITKANIITPTAQNLYNAQEDIRCFIPSIVHKTKEQIILDVEKLIRSYDPCFSCSAHFLEVEWV